MSGVPEARDSVIGVVVVNYGSHQLLASNLTPFDGSTAVRVVVVDNFHSADERAAVAALAAARSWELVTPAENGGYGEGNNQGLQRARELGCDVVMLLNPDARIELAGCLRLAEEARAQPRRLISPIVVSPDGSVWFSGSEVEPRTGRVRRSTGGFVSGINSWLSGACLMAHVDLWDELGGFDGDYFMYWEDVDLSRRCVELGRSLAVVESVQAVHDAGGTQTTSGPSGKSALYYRYNCRNRLLFAAAHLPTGQLLRWVLHTPRESARILTRGGRRPLLRAPWIMVPAFQGTAAGLGIVVGELVRRLLRRSSAVGRIHG